MILLIQNLILIIEDLVRKDLLIELIILYLALVIKMVEKSIIDIIILHF